MSRVDDGKLRNGAESYVRQIEKHLAAEGAKDVVAIVILARPVGDGEFVVLAAGLQEGHAIDGPTQRKIYRALHNEAGRHPRARGAEAWRGDVMATDEVTICNLALNAIGVTAYISDLDENSDEANACRLAYPQARDEELEVTAPGWATARMRPAPLDETTLALGEVPGGWKYAYALPGRRLAERPAERLSRHPLAARRPANPLRGGVGQRDEAGRRAHRPGAPGIRLHGKDYRPDPVPSDVRPGDRGADGEGPHSRAAQGPAAARGAAADERRGERNGSGERGQGIEAGPGAGELHHGGEAVGHRMQTLLQVASATAQVGVSTVAGQLFHARKRPPSASQKHRRCVNVCPWAMASN
jgi:hypothetical protein